MFVSTSSFSVQLCCVLTWDCKNAKGKGQKAIVFEWDKASLVVNELFCVFVKEGDLIRHVIIQVFSLTGKLKATFMKKALGTPRRVFTV